MATKKNPTDRELFRSRKAAKAFLDDKVTTSYYDDIEIVPVPADGQNGLKYAVKLTGLHGKVRWLCDAGWFSID